MEDQEFKVHLHLYSRFEASLGYMSTCFCQKKERKKKKKEMEEKKKSEEKREKGGREKRKKGDGKYIE